MYDAYVFRTEWNSKAFYDGFKKLWTILMFVYANPPFTQALPAMKKCADFQAIGGNCVLMIPTICLEKN